MWGKIMVALSVLLKSLPNAVGNEEPLDFFFLIQKYYFQSFSIKVTLQWYVAYRIFIFLFIL